MILDKLRHKLAHIIGWNYGRVETWWKGDKIMVGFRCNCGKLSREIATTFICPNCNKRVRYGKYHPESIAYNLCPECYDILCEIEGR